MLCHLTSSARFHGDMNVDLNEVYTNLVPFPRLRARLRSTLADALLEASLPADPALVVDGELSPRARLLYLKLQQSFKQKDQ